MSNRSGNYFLVSKSEMPKIEKEVKKVKNLFQSKPHPTCDPSFESQNEVLRAVLEIVARSHFVDLTKAKTSNYQEVKELKTKSSGIVT